MATTTLDMDVPDVVDIRSGERFAISSGTITIASGGQSIGRVGINSGRISITSGEVHIQSGSITIGSGAQGIGHVAVNSGKINVASGLIGVTSGKISILSGQVHILSGEITISTPTGGQVNPITAVTAASGGTILTSGAVKSIVVRALNNNTGDIFVGFSSSGQAPYSGYGVLFNPGDSWSFDIDNFGRVRVIANVSGDKVSFGGISI